MHLAQLHLFQFRNHREAGVALGPQVNCFTGPNGVGKTNLLDAVHYLSLCKSYFEPSDQHNVLHGEEAFLVKGSMVMGADTDELSCSVRRGQRKVFTRNRKEYERLADHVGRYPVVMITPYDGQLVLEGSEVRRRFLDGLISQFDRPYLEALVRYNRAMAHRNLLLKQARGRADRSMVEPWDEQLILHGEAVHAARRSFVAELAPRLQEHYQGITSGPEHVALTYRSELHERALRDLLAEAWPRDQAAEHTTVGVHRDDLLFTLEDQPLKRYGSQGQQKTYLIALKLAQFDLTAARSGLRPILLLDDIFDKIDPQRMRHLLQLLAGDRFGQVLITDTDPRRMHQVLDGLPLDVRFFALAHERPIAHETLERTIAG
ncbi:MAG: DNA replication/repair protein RecF [Flavobacteriales bacterium]|nr:DNA replication/repair protein RecF [Flavobacteriales bacterium]